MNDYDDLFDKKPEDKQEVIYTKTVVTDNSANDFYYQAAERKRNFILIAIYILVQLVITFAAGMVIGAQYGYLKEAIQQVDETTGVSFTVTENLDTEENEIYPYLVTLSGTYINKSTSIIPEFNVEIEFFDNTQKSLGIHNISYKDFGRNEIYIVSEELVFTSEPITITTQISASPPSMLYTILQLAVTTVIAGLLIFVDKLNFKRNWIDFKQDSRGKTKSIFIGFLLLYAAMYFAQIILNIVGVTQTSNNELLIRSLFSPDPLNLGILFFLLVIVTPIVEEVIFRKVLFGFIEPRSNHIIAIVVSGLVFAFMHIQEGDYIQMIPYTAMGLVLGYVYWKSNRNIYVSIGAHLLNNLVSWLVYALFMYDLIQI
jgi:membrane protease YdiL (CAAX protease family)